MTTVRRNLAWMALSQVATWSATLLIIVVLPRHMPVADFGALQLATSFVGYFFVLSAFGTNTSLVKTIAGAPTTVGLYVVNALVLKRALGSMLIVVGVAGARGLGYPPQTILLIEAGL